MTTKPLPLTGATLTVTCDARGGSVAVALINEDGNVLQQGRPVTTDATDSVVQWEAATSLEPYVGKTVRLRFEIEGAKLYSFGMEP